MSAKQPSSEARHYRELAAFFDGFSRDADHWRRRNRGYHDLVENVYRFHVPPGRSVLEVGCGTGDLLAALEPRHGVGVDLSREMVAQAARRYPNLRFVRAAGEELDLGETFDVVVLSDLVPYVHDLVGLFDRIRAHCTSDTRVIINSYSRAWRPLLRAAEIVGAKPRKPIRNWVAAPDVRNLLDITGFETITETRRIVFPKHLPGISVVANGVLANLWPVNHLCVTWWVIARPKPEPRQASVSVVVPCKNERGNVRPLLQRVPSVGTSTEIVFVEGGSRDGTRDEIQGVVREPHDIPTRFVPQSGTGKGNAVRDGFAAADHDLLMILDGDLSVRPEELPGFYRVWANGTAEFVNGSRLVYDVEPGAMRFANMVGNKLFSLLLKAIMGQQVKDTLCGTKVLDRRSYERVAAGRSYFGEFDPFGDFDLLLGAARLNLKIADYPIRYQPRTYGETNISRWRHGLLLLRMTLFAFWKFRVEVMRVKRRRGPLENDEASKREERREKPQRPFEAGQASSQRDGDELTPREAA
jgi:SAM-dependent methyltransferase/glycosyltransferase involved in cell wall biosynthesis